MRCESASNPPGVRAPWKQVKTLAAPLAATARAARTAAALGVVALMAGIQATGNYAFLNVVTALPCLPLLDDALLGAVLPARVARKCRRASSPRALRSAAVVVAAALWALVSLPGLCGLAPALRQVTESARACSN